MGGTKTESTLEDAAVERTTETTSVETTKTTETPVDVAPDANPLPTDTGATVDDTIIMLDAPDADEVPAEGAE
jgi:hypothetical protein